MSDTTANGRNRGSGRRRGGRGRERAQVAAPAFIQRQIPFYEFLGEEGLVKLEDQADWIIQEIGLEFRDDPKALQIWKAAGADVRGTRVRLERGMARELCSSAPPEFTQYARNPAHNVRIGGSSQVFAPVYGPPFVRDLDGGRRYGTLDDFEKLVKIVSQLPSLHHSGLVIVEPCDLPVSKRHLDMVYAHMKYGDKPHLGAITEKSRAQDSVDMARILHGADFMEKNCVIMGPEGVEEFWSITRYSLITRNTLAGKNDIFNSFNTKPDENGNITITFSVEDPKDGTYWMPVNAGEPYYFVGRYYKPDLKIIPEGPCK